MVPHTAQTRKEDGTGEEYCEGEEWCEGVGEWSTELDDRLISLIGDSGSYSFSGDFSPGRILPGNDLANLAGGGDG